MAVGITTGRPQKIVPVAVAVILDSDRNRVLLQRREHTSGVEGMDGMWEMPGGKIEFGEQPVETVVREIKEELGIDIVVIRLIGVRTNVWKWPDHDGHCLLIGYECRVSASFKSNGTQRWFLIDNLNYSTTLPGTREFIAAARR